MLGAPPAPSSRPSPFRPCACWLAVACAAIAPAEGRAEAVPWPQWRGPEGQGHAPHARDLPVAWSESENIAWKCPLPGRGWSSPVVAADLVWMTTALETAVDEAERVRRTATARNRQSLAVSGPVRFRALGVDRATGRLVHDVDLFTVAEPQPIHTLNSFASPSPVLADGRLYCHFGDFGTACVDTAAARVLWTNREPRLEHVNGPGSSPILWRDRLIFHCDGSDRQSIVALDAATGRLAWQTERSGALRDDPDLRKSYGTPLVVAVGGRDVLVSPAADWLYGYDPADGSERWRLSYGVLGFSVVPRPVSAHGLVFMSTSFMQPEMLAVKPGDGTAAPEIVWRQKRAAPTMASPLVVGDELYMVSDKGVASCLDARSGRVVWSERLGGNVSSSPLFADGRIYVSNREGETFVLEPGPRFVLAATNRLDGAIFATPAAVDESLYLRTDKALYRIEKPARGAR